MMNVFETCAKIDREVKAIWSTEPDDVKRLRLGIVPSGAGSFGQYFSTMCFALTYTLTMGEHTLFGLIKAADNEQIPLSALKILTREHLSTGFRVPMFISYVLAPNAEVFADDILNVLESVKDRHEFKKLLGSYFTYLNILHWWLHIYFPWSLGGAFAQVDSDTVSELRRLLPPKGET